MVHGTSRFSWNPLGSLLVGAPLLLLRNTRLFIFLFVRTFRRVCSQFWLSVCNSVEVLLIEIQEEICHFVGWEGGGFRVTKIVNKNVVNKLAFPNYPDPPTLRSLAAKSSRGQDSRLTYFENNLHFVEDAKQIQSKKMA